MPSAGDSFIVELKPAHLQWGTRGPSGSGQNRSPMEAYIQISHANASKYGIMQGAVFNAVSADGYLNCQVLAGGSQGPNLEYASSSKGTVILNY